MLIDNIIAFLNERCITLKRKADRSCNDTEMYEWYIGKYDEAAFIRRHIQDLAAFGKGAADGADRS